MSAPRILVVDDEADLRELLEMTFIKMGLDTDCVEDLTTARSQLKQQDYALVLTDMRLPDGLGIELVKEVVASTRHLPIAVITAYGSTDNAVEALKAGAFDYLSKPVSLDQLRLLVQSALKLQATPPTSALPCQSPKAGKSPLRLLGNSPAMQEVHAQVLRVARSMAPVSITGESGSGKELAARDIHAQGARADKPFIAVNCGAIPEALMEAEFFGYRKGAFTGANDDRDGFFQAANGGTLMLDEVADLPLAMQVKLLRAIQERRVRKVGATTEEAVDVRLISATHQDLASCVEQGRFRQDLYYRLNVIELRLPPLRERPQDVPLLADAILNRLAGPEQKAELSPAALSVLQQHSFPGNVRELENILERALAFANDGKIEVADLALKGGGNLNEVRAVSPEVVLQPEGQSEVLSAGSFASSAFSSTASNPPTVPEAGLPASLPDHLEKIEREVILRALEKTHFNRTQAAELLGISFRQLRYRMQRLAIHDPD